MGMCVVRYLLEVGPFECLSHHYGDHPLRLGGPLMKNHSARASGVLTRLEGSASNDTLVTSIPRDFGGQLDR